MPKLWLTYAWSDNGDQDVDHVIAELRASGINVSYDRVHLLAGRRLWEQIDAGISDPKLDAWAIYVTENSLRSEPCQEEIAYALDRALRTRGSDFPLIGIFPAPMDRLLIPSALAIRLYVNLTDPNWKQQIVDALTGVRTAPEPTPPLPYGVRINEVGGGLEVEIWRRSGRWCPFVVMVEKAEAARISLVGHAPRGAPYHGGMVQQMRVEHDDLSGYFITQSIDAQTSARVRFTGGLPERLYFGQQGDDGYHWIRISPVSGQG